MNRARAEENKEGEGGEEGGRGEISGRRRRDRHVVPLCPGQEHVKVRDGDGDKVILEGVWG